MKKKDHKTPSPFIPLEITSLRTAEAPGLVVEDTCCAPPTPKPAQGAGEEAKSAYGPTLLSLVLLLAGLLLNYLEVPWFTGLQRVAVYTVAYLLVGWRVIRQAVTRLKSSFFNEFFLMSMATLGAFYIGQYACKCCSSAIVKNQTIFGAIQRS